MRRRTLTLEALVQEIAEQGERGKPTDELDVRLLIGRASALTRLALQSVGWDLRNITRLTTKLRDSGRRSAPWRPTSSRVPGRPQDGADGNRITRWLLPIDHKFYANELDATLVEVKYYLQVLSMAGAPELPAARRLNSFHWLIEHPVQPGNYLDPIQLIDIHLDDIRIDLKTIQSGHLVPLDRGGRHVPSNAFLMLARSNALQGNMTVEELLSLMEQIVTRHRERGAALDFD